VFFLIFLEPGVVTSINRKPGLPGSTGHKYLYCCLNFFILIIKIYLLTKSRKKFEPKVFHRLLGSIASTIISE